MARGPQTGGPCPLNWSAKLRLLKRVASWIAVSIATLLVFTTPALAAGSSVVTVPITISFTTTPTSSTECYGPNWNAQTFTVGSTAMSVSSVEVYIESVTTPDSSATQSQYNDVVSLGGSYYTRVAQTYPTFYASTVSDVSFYLDAVGSPTGTITAVIRNVSDDSIIGTLGTTDASSVAHSATWSDFNTNPVTIPSTTDVRFSLEYSGGDSGDYIEVNKYDADVSPGNVSTYSSGWSEDSSSDLTWGYDADFTAAETSTVSINAVDGSNVPTSTVLTSSTFVPTGSFVYQTVSVPNCTLQANTTYAILSSEPLGGDTCYFNQGNVTTGGTGCYTSTDSGSSWDYETDAEFDYCINGYTTSVVAIVPAPDRGPFIESCEIYKNVDVYRDTMILVEYNIPYATLPDAPASSTYIVQYVNPSGTVLQSTSPISYQQSGYNYGAVAFYWAPSSGGPVWGESGSIRIIGNPETNWDSGTFANNSGVALNSPMPLSSGTTTVNVNVEGSFTISLPDNSSGTVSNGTATLTPTSPVLLTAGQITNIMTSNTGTLTITLTGTAPSGSYALTSTNWNTSTSVVAGKSQVCSYITTTLGMDLQSRWNVSLIATSSTGTVLNTTVGQLYFSQVIPNFNTICAAILSSTSNQPLHPAPSAGYNETYQQSLSQVWTNSILGPDITAAARSLGIGADLWLFGTFAVIAVIVLAFLAYRLQNPAPIPLIFIPIFIGGIRIGVVPMDLGVGVCAVLFITSMYLLIHRRAAI
jgi:hypothetical protein